MDKLDMSMIIEGLEGAREESMDQQNQILFDGIRETLDDAGLTDIDDVGELWTMVMDEDYKAVKEYINNIKR